MSDVNDNVQVPEVADVTPEATVEPETTVPQSQEENKTGVIPEMKPAEKSIPYSRFAEVNKGFKEAQRKLAEYERQKTLGQYDENDMAAIMSHPFVQDLLMKDAKYQLTDFAKGMLEGHPEVPEPVKKAILSNVRGFVKETTSDVESAKIDIQEYIDSLVEGLPQQAIQPKQFPVASTTPKETSSTANPKDVQAILEKPVDEWTEDEATIVDNYKKSQPKR